MIAGLRIRPSLRWLGVSLLLIPRAQADVIDTSGQAPWESCGYCHGIDGVSANPRFPHLAGQPVEYLRAQLAAFRTGARRNDDEVMQAMAQGLSSTDEAGIATYFSDRPLTNDLAPGRADASGQGIYRRGIAQRQVPACQGCHGAEGAGGGTVAAIGGQHVDYLLKQLEDFAAGRRSAEPMGAIARALNPAERAAVAAYAASLRRAVAP